MALEKRASKDNELLLTGGQAFHQYQGVGYEPQSDSLLTTRLDLCVQVVEDIDLTV